MRHLRRFTQPSKYEFYVSLLATMIGLWHVGTLPWNDKSTLYASASFVVGLICALDSVRDFKNMRWWERCVSATLFCFLIYWTPLYFWGAVTTTGYADR